MFGMYANHITKMSIIIVFTCCLFFGGYVFALTEEELNNMPQEMVKALPAKDVMIATGISENEFYFIIGETLLDLRYFFNEPGSEFSPELKKAIESFQSEIGHKSNGILTMEQFEILFERHNLIGAVEIYPGPVDVSIIKVGDYLEANGTWVFENDQQVDPLQTSEINCSRNSGKCYMATARISSGLLHNSNQASLFVDIEEFVITKWTEYEIQAENDEPTCVSYTLSINPSKKEAFMFRRGKGGTNCNGIAESPQLLKLESGFKVGQEFWNKRNDEVVKSRSSTYRDLIKKLEFE